MIATQLTHTPLLHFSSLISGGPPNPFCALVVDDEVVTTTAGKSHDANPFFGEEYQVSVANHFKSMSLVVYHRDRAGMEDPIGRVSFSSDDLLRSSDSGSMGEWWWLPYIEIYVSIKISYTNILTLVTVY